MTLWQDIRYGFRMLAASPGFTIVAVLSLAIGIGANSAIFSFADALLLRPLPVARPNEVLTVGSRSSFEALNASSLVSSYRDYADIRDRNKSWDGLAAFSNITVGFATDPAATPKLKMGMIATGNLLPLMGVEPTIGRTFRPDEDQVPNRDAVVILGRTMWEQEFASDPGVLGKSVRINGTAFTIIGVAPGSFTGMNTVVRTDFFVPMMMSPRVRSDAKVSVLEARDARNLRVRGRLKPGVTQAEAQSELTAIATDLERAYPATNKNQQFFVRTEMQERVAQDPPDAMLVAMLSTLAIGVLLVACGNVAGLLTSRAPARAREMALRLAIGAGRGRLVRQLITESLLISIAGGGLGLAVGYAGMMLFRQIEIPSDLPIMLTFQMDRRALVFSLVVAVASAVIFGLVPAVQASRTDLTGVMKAGDAVAPGRRRRWGRAILACAQVATSVVLLVVAMFMYRGFREQLTIGPGYRTDHLMMVGFDTSLIRYSDAQAQQFFRDAAERARAVPGVKAVTLTSSIPMLNDSISTMPVAPEGFQFPPGRDNAETVGSRIDEYYFDALAIPLLAGRNFTRQDDETAPRVAIVNQHFAEHYWPGQDPLGKRFRLKSANDAWVQIVGVAKMAKYIFIAEPPTDFIYLPYRQNPSAEMMMVAQSVGDAGALAAPLREVVRGLDVNMPTFSVRTMEQLYHMRAISIFNVLVTMVGAMGLMGLALSIVGLYGLVAYSATRRTREIGIRMAIGATAPTVLRMVLRQGLALAVTGLVVGLAGALGAGVLMAAAFPSGNDQQDFLSLAIVAPVVLLVTALATYIPARRASRVNPTEALRYE